MDFDGVAVAVLNQRFQAIVRRMANTLGRTGRSGVINTARDYSCCILSADGGVLAIADSLPIHVMSGPDIMARAMKEFFPTLRRGDGFLHNSPYHGNSHPADHAILMPVVDDEGEHRFTVLAKAHQADIGNAAPTTYMAAARDVYEEGALIFPVVQVLDGYKHRMDVVRMCRMRIRSPELWWGDFLALSGAAQIGERSLMELASEYSWAGLDAYARQWFDYGEGRMRAAIRELPAGDLTVETCHDPFPNVPDGVPIQVRVRIDPVAGRIEVDLRDNPDCVPCGLNTSEATARTAAMIGIYNSIDPDVPINAGAFRCLDVLLRENCAVGIPRHPASCSVATTGLANRVGNAVQRAMAELAEGAGMGEIGLLIPPSDAVISGYDSRARRPFVNQLFLGASGGAGGPRFDGWLNTSDLGGGGMIHVDSIEIDEARYPLLVWRRSIIPDSEGAGCQRGAPGYLVEYGPTEGPLELMYASDGTKHPAQGSRGGGSGAPAFQSVRTARGEVVPLSVYQSVTLEDGECVISRSCGGGGYGNPKLRNPERVARDVAEGWISVARAEDVYGVRVTPNGEVDDVSTTLLRGSQPPTSTSHS